MTYKTILVHIDNGPRCAQRLDIAIDLAQRFDAHLVGLHALTVTPMPSYAIAEAGITLAETREKVLREYAARAQSIFEAAITRSGWEKSEWRASGYDAVEAVTLHGRYADLIVVGQPQSEEASGVDPDFAERMLLRAGRPVLMIPYAGTFKSVGKRILIAWNASRESTRAVTDAIPFMKQAEQVTAAAFNPIPGQHGQVPGADIGLYLARHGVKVTATEERSPEVDVGNQLLSRAADLDVDLLVMGGYGHSRISELVLGGVTRTIFKSMTVPVLMSH